VGEAGDEARPEPDDDTQQGQADADAQEAAGEQRAIETILGEIRGEGGDGVRVPAFPDVVGG
jgi:hypothetical protein